MTRPIHSNHQSVQVRVQIVNHGYNPLLLRYEIRVDEYGLCPAGLDFGFVSAVCGVQCAHLSGIICRSSRLIIFFMLKAGEASVGAIEIHISFPNSPNKLHLSFFYFYELLINQNLV